MRIQQSDKDSRTEVAAIPFWPFCFATGALFSISYVLCVLLDLLMPKYAMHSVWQPMLPGFTWLTFPSFLLGLLETVIYGLYVAIIFVPSFNWATKRRNKSPK